MSNQEKHFYEFGPFRLDPVKRRLLRDGAPIPLTPKAFDTLFELVRQSGKTIDKDDLMKEVWPDAIVEENNLTQNISALRRLLGDTRQDRQYIATIPGSGYRFVAEVKRSPQREADATLEESQQSSLIVEPGIDQHKGKQIEKSDSMAIGSQTLFASVPSSGESIIAFLKRHKKIAVLALVLILNGVAGIAFWIYEIVGPGRTETSANEIDITPLTRTGTVGSAAISPDGKQIVYSVHEGGRESLWLRQVVVPSPLRIVPPAEVVYFALTFSLEGNHIIFLRSERDGSVRALYRMPAFGGVPTKLLADVDSRITLSPDGARMAFVRNSSEESALIIADVNGSNQHKLATRPITDYFKIPAWSPDGKLIACSSGSGEPYDIHNSIIAVRVEDGNQSPLTPQKWASTYDVEWLADGSGLLITARERHEAQEQIWRIPYPEGVPRRLTGDSKLYRSISLARNPGALIAVQTELVSDIWVASDLRGEQGKTKVNFGTGSYENASYAPDGRIVYASQASGNWDIWIMDADGNNKKQLTADAGVNLHQRATSDGRHIVFASNRAGVFNIWRINIDGSDPVQLTRGSGEKFPDCSPDGKWVVYNSVASDQNLYAIWKVSIEGGEPVRLTDANTEHPAVSPDGKRIAYFYSSKGKYQIVVIPFDGGHPERVFDIPRNLDPLTYVHWFPDGQSLTYSAALNDVSNIWMQPLDGEAKQLTDFKVEGRLLFDWSHDGKQLVFIRRMWPADLVLLRNFTPGKT